MFADAETDSEDEDNNGKFIEKCSYHAVLTPLVLASAESNDDESPSDSDHYNDDGNVNSDSNDNSTIDSDYSDDESTVSSHISKYHHRGF